MPRKNITKDHIPLLVEIGSKLKEIRETKKTSIQEMAEDLKMSRNGYALMEKGQIYFNFSTLLSILDKLDIDYSDFFKDL